MFFISLEIELLLEFSEKTPKRSYPKCDILQVFPKDSGAHEDKYLTLPNSDMGHPGNMMGAVPGNGDTVYAANPFDDNPGGGMGGMAPAPGMSPNSMGPNGSPSMGGGPGTPNNMIPPPNSMGMY